MAKRLVIIIIAMLISVPASAQYRYYFPIIYKSTPIISLKKGVSTIPPHGCADAATMQSAWYYNWQPAAEECESAEFIPMIWGANNFEATLATAVEAAQGSGWLMGFNEPDYYKQSNISPTTAAVLWRRIESEAGSIKLVSPAVSQHDPGWLDRMVEAYHRLYGKPPRFDSIGVHIYSADRVKMQTYILAWHNRWPGKPLWITEWNGCYEWSNPGLMTEMVPWLEAQAYIARYAWFVSRPDANPDSQSPCTLLTPDGELTTAGWQYRVF